MAAKGTLSTLVQLARQRGAAQPDDSAWVFRGRETTYGAFDALTSRVAAGLVGLGLKPGDRVAYIGKNSDVFYELLFGAAKAGVVLVPVNWRLAPAEITYIVNDAGAEVLFVGTDFADVVRGILGELPGVLRVVSLDAGNGDWEGYESWRQRHAAERRACPYRTRTWSCSCIRAAPRGSPKGRA